jgi:hypothetical protein
MGRHSCCHKQKLKKGLWSPEEDEKLVRYITKCGHGCWSAVPKQAGAHQYIYIYIYIYSAFNPYHRIPAPQAMKKEFILTIDPDLMILSSSSGEQQSQM